MFVLGTALGRELLFGMVTDVIATQSGEVLATEIESSVTSTPTPLDEITVTLTPILDGEVNENASESAEIQLSITPKPEESPTPEITLTTNLSPTITPSPTPTEVITVTPTPSYTPTLTPTPTTLPTITSKPLVAPAYMEPLFNQYAAFYNVDGQLLRKIANCESHYNTGVVGGGGLYGGMFQFAVGSWQSMRKQMGLDPNPDLRFGASESIQTAAYALSLGKASMWPSCSK
jgi:hypothetical protein